MNSKREQNREIFTCECKFLFFSYKPCPILQPIPLDLPSKYIQIQLWPPNSKLPPQQAWMLQATNIICLVHVVLVYKGCHNKTLKARWIEQHKTIFSQSWRLKVQGQGDGRVGVFCGLSLWLVDGQHLLPLTWSFLCLCASLVSFLCVQISSYKDTSLIGLEPTLKASFKLNYLQRSHLQIQSHSDVLRILVLTQEFWGTQLSPKHAHTHKYICIYTVDSHQLQQLCTKKSL